MTTSTERKRATAIAVRRLDTVIDGEATVLARVARVKSAIERAAAAPIVVASDAAEETGRGSFGRRNVQSGTTRRTQAGDLVFPSPRMERFAARTPKARPGLRLFLRDTAGTVPAGGKVALLGLIVVSLLVPAALMLRPEQPLAATAGGRTAGLVIEELSATVSPRGEGEVLLIEGAVRNTSSVASAIPSLSVALSERDGTRAIRPVHLGVAPLAAGATVRFHSAVAVPAGTVGDVSVDFSGGERVAASL